MARIDKEVFIQNIKDTTTVLQQLRICIDQIKEVIDEYVEKSELQALTQTVSYISDALNNHKNNKNNPHEVTKAQVGLANVNNTSDVDKPISSATRAALNDINEDLTEHVNDTSNPHNVTKAQIGLANVDNTSDTDKPISTATQNALDGKQATLVSGTNIKTINNQSLLGSGNIVIQGGGGSPTIIDIEAGDLEQFRVEYYYNSNDNTPVTSYDGLKGGVMCNAEVTGRIKSNIIGQSAMYFTFMVLAKNTNSDGSAGYYNTNDGIIYFSNLNGLLYLFGITPDDSYILDNISSVTDNVSEINTGLYTHRITLHFASSFFNESEHILTFIRF